MEVKAGYRQTEAGTIPQDWEILTIQELIDRGAVVGHLDGNHGELYPRSHEFKESGVPYITANDLCGHRVSFSNCKYLPESRARRFRKGIAKNGDVLFAHNATVGPTALLSMELDYVILSTTATYFRCSLEKLLNSYLLYALQSAYFVGQYRAVMAQSTRNQVPITTQRKLSIVIPPTKTEQEAIAEALSDADALIESLEQLLTKKRQLKQGAMQELLRPKPGDAVRLLGEVSSLKGRIGWQGLKQTEFTSNDDEPFLITGMNFKDGAIRWNEVYHISETRYELAPEIQLRPNDVLMTKDGTIGKVLYIDTIPFPGKASLNSHLLLFRPIGGSYYPKYLYYQLGSRRFKDFVELSKSGTTFFGLSQAAVAAYPVLLPLQTEQVRIATVLCDMDIEIAALEAKLTKARQLKQGMMQELLTGRIRLVRPSKSGDNPQC